MDKLTEQNLIGKAMEARTFAYAPYSGFTVGAALLAKNGQVYLGCNIENAAYTPTNCAERTAFFKAVSEGVTEFTAIAIVGGKPDTPEEERTLCSPCGVCRQVMREFCSPKEFRVILAVNEENYRVCRLEELFPLGFGPENLCTAEGGNDR